VIPQQKTHVINLLKKSPSSKALLLLQSGYHGYYPKDLLMPDCNEPQQASKLNLELLHNFHKKTK
jgi:hypothetical protein